MTHEYDDPITDERFEAAVRLVLRRWPERPQASVGDLAAEAVEQVFCMCVTGAEDAAEGKFSAIHMALIAEVNRRAEARTGVSDPVNQASADSFPASDPPAWIWSRGAQQSDK